MKKYPCKSDHNGECEICNCTLDLCAYDRWVNNDYKWESEKELEEMFGSLKSNS